MENLSIPIQVEQLAFRYRDRQELAIHDISFQVQAGELLLIAGASGCGKSTLIRAINGLVPRSYKGELSGRVLLSGEDPREWPLSRISQMVGTVLQDPERQILGTMVLNEVAFGLENLGFSRSEILERADAALNYLKIGHLRDRETFNLSGGEKQKVALAGVLAMRPKVLLLDEPLASLDPASAQEALQLVRQLIDEGMTVLLVEHRVEDVMKIQPDRVMYMDQGTVRYLGDPEGLFRSVDYRQVKLPAAMILEMAKNDPEPGFAGTRFMNVDRSKPAESMVEFNNVGFGYERDTTVLDNINLTIRRGDVIAVLGPNGAGKTTLVKHAIGLLKPKSGQVLVQGKDTRDLSVAEIAANLGYVFQSPSHMLFAPTVREELEFGPTNLRHSKEKIKKEVAEALTIVNLEGYQDDPPLSLSFGQQKRVSIAAILAMRSRILVMDEPTAGQDYFNYMNFMDAILDMPGFEAILFITHDIDLAVIYANRVLLVAGGRIVADGSPYEVLSDYERLEASRMVPTSLLDVNLQAWPRTQQFMRAEILAHQ